MILVQQSLMILWRASLRTTGTSPLEMSLLTHRWSRYIHWEHHNSIMLNYCYKSISSNDFRYYQYPSIPILADTDDAAKGPVEELSFSHKSNSTRWEKSSDLITLITMISHDIMISWYQLYGWLVFIDSAVVCKIKPIWSL